MSKGIDVAGYLVGIFWVLLVTSAIVVKDIPDDQAAIAGKLLYATALLLVAIVIVKCLDPGSGCNEPAA